MIKDKTLYVILLISFLINILLVLKVHRMILSAIDDEVRTEVIHSVDTIKINNPVPTDTVYLNKTVRIPIYLHSDSLKGSETYKLPQTEKETLRESFYDTVYIDVPKEQRIYQDTLYMAWVSGVEPTLDSIRVYNHQTTITNTITKKKKPVVALCVAPYAGYSIGSRNFDYGVGISLGIPLWSW